MCFYDLLQLDPAVIKSKIRAAETSQEKRRLWAAMVLRSILIVLFAIVFIAPTGSIFGAENSPMGVALFCIFLGIRFVDFGYCIKDSLVTLAIAFSLLLVGPVAASLVHPLLAACIHFVSFLTILMMTCDRPEMGNGGLYGFAYVFLTGNPVTGESFWKRALLTLCGYLLCGAILFFKHRHKNTEVRFHEVASKFHLSNEKHRWQFRMALGVSFILSLGSFLQLERFMWMGFACTSLLSSYPYTTNVKERLLHRIWGVVVGSTLFFLVYQLMPENLHFLMGPVGGFCLGFCTDYRYKTAINCFGALMMATGLYGVHGAVLLRIFNNILGVILGFVFIFLYEKLIGRYFVQDPEKSSQPTT